MFTFSPDTVYINCLALHVCQNFYGPSKGHIQIPPEYTILVLRHIPISVAQTKYYVINISKAYRALSVPFDSVEV